VIRRFVGRGLGDSLFARLALIFASGLAITLGVLIWVHLPEREAFVFRLSAARVERIG
jgi:hypothetical protein